jgi:hypothetical protein
MEKQSKPTKLFSFLGIGGHRVEKVRSEIKRNGQELGRLSSQNGRSEQQDQQHK